MKLFARHLGSAHARPVLIMHGLFGSSDNWMRIGKALGEKYSVYLLDLRNHGNSPHSETHTYPAMTEDVREFLNDHGIDQATLIGHSMGGKVAMLLAQQYPHKVQKLVVVDVAPKVYSTAFFEQLLSALLSLDLSRLRSRQDADAQLASRIPNSVIRNFLLKNLARDEEGRFYWRANLPVLYRSLREIGDTIPEGEPFTGPTLFIRGGNSPYIQPEDEPLLRSRFPTAEIVTIPGAGHWVHYEAPEAFLRVVDKFLES